MTTDARPAPLIRGTAVLVRTAGAVILLGLLAIGLGGLLSGSAAAYGALVGTVLVVGVFGFGTFTVNAVAAVMPTASLLVAVMTYTLQVVAMALAFVILSGSGALDETIDRAWLGGTVIAGTMVWLVVQIVQATSRRIPIYDVSLPDVEQAPASRAEGAQR
jgi:ATP synthase protein I